MTLQGKATVNLIKEPQILIGKCITNPIKQGTQLENININHTQAGVGSKYLCMSAARRKN